jgi:ketosteroid isomerase-like protein
MRLSRSSYGVLLALPLLLVACAGEPDAEAAPPPEPMSEAGAKAVRDAFVNTYMSKNAAGAAAFYAESAIMYGPDGSVANGRAAIEAEFTRMMQAGMDSLGMAQASFQATGDEAVEQGTLVMRTLDPQTKEASYMNGGYMITYGRQPDGGFQIVKDSVWAAPAR